MNHFVSLGERKVKEGTFGTNTVYTFGNDFLVTKNRAANNIKLFAAMRNSWCNLPELKNLNKLQSNNNPNLYKMTMYN